MTLFFVAYVFCVSSVDGTYCQTLVSKRASQDRVSCALEASAITRDWVREVDPEGKFLFDASECFYSAGAARIYAKAAGQSARKDGAHVNYKEALE